MSASKSLAEINKVQSFLKRINGKVADAIFFIVFWGEGGKGKLHFQSNEYYKEL